MSIARMEKLTVIGLSKDRDSLMEELMRLGVVQITAQDAKLTDDEWRELVAADGNEEAVAKWEGQISRVAQAIETLQKYSDMKKPLIRTRLAVRQRDFDRVMDREVEIRKKADHVLSLSDQLTEVKNRINRAETQKLSLLPWKDYDLPLSLTETKTVRVVLGAIPAASDPEVFRSELEEKAPDTESELVGSDKDQHYFALFLLKAEEEKANEVLRDFSFSRIAFPEFEGMVSQCIESCEKETEELLQQESELIKLIKTEEQYEPDLEFLHDGLIMKRDRQKIRSRLLKTDSVFYLEGWVPRMAVDRVEMLLRVKECWYEAVEARKGEETPVLLLNNAFNSPFESVTRLYALPDSRGLDPTPFFSFFYALFFGMMLSDAAYGLIITIATLIIKKKFRLEGMMKKMISMFFYCGIATMFWGVMFGGYFGDLITVVADTFFGKEVVIQPLWFNPLEDPMTLLIFSFILGTIHLFLGMGLSAYMSVKDGRPLDALFDVGFWYLLLVGLVMFLCGKMAGLLGPVPTNIGMWMAVIGAVGILLTGGRDKKGFGRITGGLGSLYNITSYLSDVLSYSRLLALGLATGVISTVFNTLGSLAGGGVLGMFAMLIAFVVGHTYNLAINSLGSFVHSCRLQYVEFFGKFYESGGEAFDPFSENTKYIQILREEK
ncbi:V-type ATP synthase subunit I [Bacilliculturomica massiliensis]|uniref:V-type ATP synthase subunit I n=1 Tax=Bacilliculturomica massiliensis TaxID=1917867 RepID=UPI0010320B99|nr:V-type ATP synthase subunit I [Bacilliculturomica massiliensis]